MRPLAALLGAFLAACGGDITTEPEPAPSACCEQAGDPCGDGGLCRGTAEEGTLSCHYACYSDAYGCHAVESDDACGSPCPGEECP